MLRVYEGVRKRHGGDTCIVLVSSDRNQAAFDEHLSTVLWPAIPFAEFFKRTGLSDKYDVQGLPSLVILGPGSEVLARNVAEAIRKRELASVAEYPAWLGAGGHKPPSRFVWLPVRPLPVKRHKG